ncbi:MAG TPA: hypothetical protein G4O16_09050 [Dehalococcoidia bacterium]|nr:hypothetical protein [Dehalococcoidia bacterium]
MTKIEHNIIIQSPPDRVFDFTSNWQNFVQYFGYIKELKPASNKTTGEGALFATRVKFMGLTLSSLWEMAEYVPNETLTLITPLMGVRAKKHWRFTPENGSTRVMFTLEYKPWPLVGPLLDMLFMKRYWEKMDAKLVQNLKRLIET